MYASFIITEQEIAEALKYHSLKQQKQFDELYDAFGDEAMLMAHTLKGRLHTKILPCRSAEYSTLNVLFPTLCRLNRTLPCANT
jgi:hypothetical protein